MTDVISAEPRDPRTSDPTVTESRLIRVASVPASHVYVRHLSATTDGGRARVSRLPDPHPSDPSREAVERWWPPAMLQEGWVREHAEEFDIFHLQFGFDAQTPDQLRALVADLKELGKPLVYTVHDLRNPHHSSRLAHDAQLDILIPAADAIITLTEGAGYEIKRRWARNALVLAHPHVVDFDTMRRVRHLRENVRRARSLQDDAEYRIGLHLKSLRPNTNAEPVLRALLGVVDELPGAVLRVDGHRDVMQPDGIRFDQDLADLLRESSTEGRIELRIHDYFDDDELWTYLSSLDLSVLPYRFGTHSGWLEACRDLGTPVLAPSCGYYKDQAPVFQYLHDDDGLDVPSLQSAVRRSYDARSLFFVTPDERGQQRERLAEAHAALYLELLA